MARDDGIKLVAVQDPELDLVVFKDIFIVNVNSHDVADNLGWTIVIAAHPDDLKIASVSISPNDAQAIEMVAF